MNTQNKLHTEQRLPVHAVRNNRQILVRCYVASLFVFSVIVVVVDSNQQTSIADIDPTQDDSLYFVFHVSYFDVIFMACNCCNFFAFGSTSLDNLLCNSFASVVLSSFQELL